MTDLTLRRALARQLRFTQHLTDAGAWSGAAEGLLPIIAAREAEVVGRILDRIDALHEKRTTRVYTERDCQDGICDDHHDSLSGARYCPSYLLDVCWECSHYCCDDGDRDEPFPCPTRRLTAEIRGELSHG